MINNIAKFRKEKKISQEKLANHLNITREQLSRLENGHAEPSLAMADMIAVYFGVTVYELFVTMGSTSAYNLQLQKLKDDANAAYKDGMRKAINIYSENPYE